MTSGGGSGADFLWRLRDARSHRSHAPGTPCWIDLIVPGRQAALDFCRELFGWQGEVGAAPFGMVAGRMAVVRDPRGAMFALLDPAPMNPAVTSPEFRPGGERL